jgi:hypothetical protein
VSGKNPLLKVDPQPGTFVSSRIEVPAFEGRQIQSGSNLDTQPELSSNQKALKDKFGLNECVCANFKAGDKEMLNFVDSLKRGKFDPGISKKFLLWLSYGSGGPKYEAAARQFRAKTAITKDQEFQENLATAINSCDSTELSQVSQWSTTYFPQIQRHERISSPASCLSHA